MPHDLRPGDVLAGRYRLVDLMSEAGGGRFWYAHDQVLARHVAVHIISSDDDRAQELVSAARRSATLHDARLLRVLDADTLDGTCFVVNEWGEGRSLDAMVLDQPLTPRRAAWIVAEVGQLMTVAHAQGMAHGRLVPENVLVDDAGAVKVIGFGVDAALHGVTDGSAEADVANLAGLLYTALTGKWPGNGHSRVPPAPRENGEPLRPRQVRAGIPRPLDSLCDEMLTHPRDEGPTSAQEVVDALVDFVGDVGLVAQEEATRQRDDQSTVRRRRAGGPGAVLPPGAPAAPFEQPVGQPVEQPGAQPLHEPSPTAEVPAQPAAQPAAQPTAEPTAEPPGEEPTRVVPTPPADEPAPPADEPTRPLGTQPAAESPTAEEPAQDHDETQAGVPVFYENADHVDWAPTERSEPAPPPPPFEEHPERPLFAPDPPEGAARRTPPEPAPAPATGDHWFWGADTGSSSPHAGVEDADRHDEPVPGRHWMQGAAAIAVALVVLVVVVLAFNRGRDDGSAGGSGGEPSSGPTASTQAPALQPVRVAGIADFDPFGDERVENPEDAPLAIDGDPATGWQTSRYDQDFGPGGLKPGVGLLLDLGQEQEIGEVRVTLAGAPTDLEVRTAVGEPAPTTLEGFEVAASGTAPGAGATLTPEQPVKARWLLVWLTSLPPTEGGFRGQVLEVVVRG